MVTSVPDSAGFNFKKAVLWVSVSLTLGCPNGQLPEDSCQQTVLCQVFFDLPTGTVTSTTTLLHDFLCAHTRPLGTGQILYHHCQPPSQMILPSMCEGHIYNYPVGKLPSVELDMLMDRPEGEDLMEVQC